MGSIQENQAQRGPPVNILEQHHPFYRPLWRRIAIVVAIGLWLGFEVVYSRDLFWMIIAGCILAYGIWTFFLSWPKTPGTPPK
jgi:hypothetical protein